jgi:hypothetical protein
MVTPMTAQLQRGSFGLAALDGRIRNGCPQFFGQARSKFRDARSATQNSQAGPVTLCKLCDPGVFGIHQLLRIIDVVKANDTAQFVHYHRANQKWAIWPRSLQELVHPVPLVQ